MSTNNRNNEEEVDLGSLFVIIGKGFSNFFNFIGSIFKGIFHFTIILLLFLKQHIIPVGIAAILGFIVGFFLEIKSPKRYSSDLLLQTNYKSSRQLYDNISFYNNLVKQKDTLGLKETFELDTETAISLKKFTITPIKNQNDIISGYDDLILKVDTATIRSYDFKDFEASFTDFDYKLHQITVVAEKNNVFKSLDELIIAGVVESKYFTTLKKLTTDNLNRTDSIYRQNLVQIDSLGKVYMQVLLAEAKKESNGTSIDFAGQNKSTKEIELFYTNKRINEDLADLAEAKSQKFEIINIISNFQPIGNEVNEIIENKAFQLSCLFALLTILILLLFKLNIYLEDYKK
ncbi:hypothetical protein OAD34_03210 [Flavobacteriaceae bacterium]|nr:hypothetical protein [Flavobacteriaceae bacterium]